MRSEVRRTWTKTFLIGRIGTERATRSMFIEGLSEAGRQPSDSLTHIVPKRTTLLPSEYQFEYVVFRKSVVLEGARGSVSRSMTPRKHARYGTAQSHP